MSLIVNPKDQTLIRRHCGEREKVKNILRKGEKSLCEKWVHGKEESYTKK